MNEEYKAALRELVARKGKPVEFYEPRSTYEDPEECVSPYGWVWHEADEHTLQMSDETRTKYRHNVEDYPGCEWVIDEGAVLKERTYSEFAGTEASNNEVVGINVTPARCKCGKYTGVTLRYTASLAETLRELFGHDDKIITL